MAEFHQPLTPGQLLKRCDPAAFDFSTTDELAGLNLAIGQERALEALQFGLSIAQQGFNIFALGPAGLGKTSAIRDIISRESPGRQAPDDWCYVHNFAEPAKPRALRLPAGLGQRFAGDMNQLIEELITAIPAIFEREEYRARAEEIEEKAKDREATAVNELRSEARQQQVALIETPTGYAFAPINKSLRC